MQFYVVSCGLAPENMHFYVVSYAVAAESIHFYAVSYGLALLLYRLSAAPGSSWLALAAPSQQINDLSNFCQENTNIFATFFL